MFGAILATLTPLVTTFMDNKKEKAAATHERDIAILNGERAADTASANDMSNSLKDEYLTLLVSAPLIIIFYAAMWGDPQQIEQVKQAFVAMSELPEWFQYSFMGCIVSTFGLRSFKTFKA